MMCFIIPLLDSPTAASEAWGAALGVTNGWRGIFEKTSRDEGGLGLGQAHALESRPYEE